MTSFTDAIRQQEEPDLMCPHCDAANTPRLRVIVIDLMSWTAVCNQCGQGGPVERFKQKDRP